MNTSQEQTAHTNTDKNRLTRHVCQLSHKICCIKSRSNISTDLHYKTHTALRIVCITCDLMKIGSLDIEGIHERMARFQKLTRNLFITLHGHSVHRQQRQLSKFVMRCQQFACRAYCDAILETGPAVSTSERTAGSA